MNKLESECNDTTNVTATKSEPNVCCGIYGLRNKVNDKWYIGQSVDIFDRWKDYKRLKCKNQRKILHALKKYGYDGFEKRIIELCDNDIPQSVLDLKEDSWIRHLNSIDNGYNIRNGGSRGRHTDETKRLLSHRNISAESRKRMSESATGKIISDETRRKISTTLQGRKFSAEHRRKISDANRRRVVSDDTRLKQRAKRMPESAKKILSNLSKNQTRDYHGRYVKTDLPSFAPRSG